SIEARFLYDSLGMRVKKWVRTNGVGPGDSVTSLDGIFERHTWKEVGRPSTFENNHLHLIDFQGRIATLRVGDLAADDAAPDVQYPLGDHQGSSSVVVGG